MVKMKSCIFTLGVIYLGQVAAFELPNEYTKNLPNAATLEKYVNGIPILDGKYGEYVPNFGQYKFVPPGKKDVRGPCPALNTLANHGYIPRSGVATVEEFIVAMKEVWGVSPDLGSFLAGYGAATAGDGHRFSIGGVTKETLYGLGLIGSHNIYEGDSSFTRGDWFVYKGDNYHVRLREQFIPFYEKRTDYYRTEDFINYRETRFRQSLDFNPYFCSFPISSLVVLANYVFSFRLFPDYNYNYTGIIDRRILKSWFSVYDKNGGLVYKPGWERIPDNYYKRPVYDEYTLGAFFLDAIKVFKQYPDTLKVGCNTGKVDSFFGIDVADLTGGVFNAVNLLEGNNLLCFWYQVSQAVIPTAIRQAVFDSYAKLDQTYGMSDVINGLGCPQLMKYDTELFKTIPGWNGTYPFNFTT